MSETCEGSDSQSGNQMLGSDHFSFYSRAIVALFSQSEGALAFCSERLDCVGKESGVSKNNDLNNTSLSGYHLRHDYKTGGPVSLFSDAIGPQLSDFAKERITALVRHSLFNFSKEIDSIVEAVLGISRLQSILRYKESLLKHHEAPRDADTEHDPRKRQKVLPSVEMDKDLRLILDAESSKVEQLVKKHSAELLTKIEHMKQKLEDFVDLLLSNFRPMTLTERQKLQKLIKNLPPQNLDRVVEIIKRGKPCSEEIHVDLEEQSNVTLWRLYIFVGAVESARKLCEVR
ncbi:OLC1v1011304C2 [Oldenlandia corymbosa var. corymbosa]|nr:OLC1v1011304C2 [Oldenlandia corymbosa var. corymbosa]